MTARRLARLLLAPLLLAATLAGAAPADAADVLTIAIGAPATSLDPHLQASTPNNAAAAHFFDALTDMDGRSRLVPGLAESWQAVDEHTWAFTLRAGVKFHDGSPLTADDVVFTYRRVGDPANNLSNFSPYLSAVASVEATGPLAVRITTKAPAPTLPADLSQIMILSRRAAAGVRSEDFNSGKALVGTGPFKFAGFVPGDRIEMDRNDDYWRGAPAWSHVRYRMVANNAARAAALLSGDVGLIDAVPTADIARLRDAPHTGLAQVDGRFLFLLPSLADPDQTPFATDADGRPLHPNPLRDHRVRQALSLAINRTALADRIMAGAATPTAQFVAEGSIGHVPDLAAPAFDLDKARQLLKEAGFPSGFRLTLHGPNDRYANDGAVLQAIGQMWTRAGVRTEVVVLPWAVYRPRAAKQEYSVTLLGLGNPIGDATPLLRYVVASFAPQAGMGAFNDGRYSNPAVDDAIVKSLSELDGAKRAALLQTAATLAVADVGIIPLYMQRATWAMSDSLRYAGRVDEETRAAEILPR